jgi:hypothetical protein
VPEDLSQEGVWMKRPDSPRVHVLALEMANVESEDDRRTTAANTGRLCKTKQGVA